MRRLDVLVGLHWPTLALGAMAAGLAASNWLDAPWLAGALGACAASARVLVGARLPPAARLLVTGIALVAAGLWWGGLRVEAIDRAVLAPGSGPALAEVVITGQPTVSPYAVRVTGDVRRFGSLRLRERVLLELASGRAPPQGAILLLRGRPVEPRGPEDGFDEKGWLHLRGVHVVLRSVGGWRVIGRRGGLAGVGDRLREQVRDALAGGTRGERRALTIGVVLGADEGIDRDLRNAFKASGLYHLLAVSGQNIAFIGLGILGLAYVAGVPRAFGHVLAIAAILAYALAVGWQPSVVRATVAGCLGSLAWLLARDSDRWHAMAAGAVVLLAWTPRSLLEPGFQLSFVAVAAIFLAVPRVRRLADGTPLPRPLVEVVGISTACGVATAPVLWLQFGAIPLWTVPANVLAEPAMPLLLGCGLAASLLAPVVPAAAVALSWLAGVAAAWLALTARAVASLPYAQLSSRTLAACLVLALAAAAVLAALPPQRRVQIALSGALLVPLLAVGWWALRQPSSWRPPAGLRVSFLDVGQGDAVLLETREGALLVDAGPPEAQVVRQLRRMGLRALAALVVTHAHRDHVGGGPDVLRRLHVGAVLDPLQPGAGPDERGLRRAARREGVPLVPIRAGRVYHLGRLRVRVLWPDGAGPEGEDPHLHGTVMLATYGAIDILLTGDSESPVQRMLPLRSVEVVKVAHHGSSDPGLPEVLRTLRPRLAVISVGAHNDYGHPRADTLAALAARPGLRTLRTDQVGRIVLETDGRSLTVRTDRGVR